MDTKLYGKIAPMNTLVKDNFEALLIPFPTSHPYIISFNQGNKIFGDVAQMVERSLCMREGWECGRNRCQSRHGLIAPFKPFLAFVSGSFLGLGCSGLDLFKGSKDK
ncbi:unnamed protein product, partial [Sphenostylis stenocarpa]